MKVVWRSMQFTRWKTSVKKRKRTITPGTDERESFPRPYHWLRMTLCLQKVFPVVLVLPYRRRQLRLRSFLSEWIVRSRRHSDWNWHLQWYWGRSIQRFFTSSVISAAWNTNFARREEGRVRGPQYTERLQLSFIIATCINQERAFSVKSLVSRERNRRRRLEIASVYARVVQKSFYMVQKSLHNKIKREKQLEERHI